VSQCRLCHSKPLVRFSSITFGVWLEHLNEIVRDSDDYLLGQCKQCGHVQVAAQYTPELLNKLYFNSAQEAVMWHESLISNDAPYHEMVEFACEGHSPNTIVDFGCGEGKLLSVARAKFPKSALVGIDFNDRFCQENIDYLAYNLNDLSKLPTTYWANGIDLAMASHVLEHIVNPVLFLKNIASHLSVNGMIFVEVPDFSNCHDLSSIGRSNLVNLQHIHYFTLDSLRYAANQVGLQIMSSKQVTTGYIPRLQVLVARDANIDADVDVSSIGVRFKAAESVIHYQDNCREHRVKLAGILLETINQDGKVGIWGIGADFYLLMKEHPALVKAIVDNQLVMFDQSLKGKTYSSRVILSSSEIPQQIYEVIICPQLAETSVKMSEVSKEWLNVRSMSYDQ
jgi:SAM-dependent methyltransferase